MLTMDSSSAMNHSDFHTGEVKYETFKTQDREFLSVSEDLIYIDDTLHSQSKNNNVKVTSEGRISGYFCSDTIFNLSHGVLTKTEIRVLEKGLDYAPIQKKINAPELRKDFSERFFIPFYEVLCFKTKLSWKNPNGRPNLEIFVSKVEKDLFNICKKQNACSNFNSEEWKAMRSSADDQSLVI